MSGHNEGAVVIDFRLSVSNDKVMKMTTLLTDRKSANPSDTLVATVIAYVLADTSTYCVDD